MSRTSFKKISATLTLLFLGAPFFVFAAGGFQSVGALSEFELNNQNGPGSTPLPQTATKQPTAISGGNQAFSVSISSNQGNKGLTNNCKQTVFDGAAQGTYCFLAPITGESGLDLTVGRAEDAVSNYLRNLFTLFISAGGIALFFSLVWAGLQYIWGGAAGNLVNVKSAQERIKNAAIGTAIGIGSYLILQTINPDIVKFSFHIPPIELRGGAAGQNAIPDYVGAGVKAVSNAAGSLSTGQLPTKEDITAPFQSNAAGADSSIGTRSPYAAIVAGTGGTEGFDTADTSTTLQPKITGYYPQNESVKQTNPKLYNTEGGYTASTKGLDGTNIIHTLDTYNPDNPNSYVTLAGSPSEYGKYFIVPNASFKDDSGVVHSYTNVRAYVHDTGSDFKTTGTSHYDMAIARDYSENLTSRSPYADGGIKLVQTH